MRMALDRRILIADDDREIRLGMADLLGSMGLEILQALREGASDIHIEPFEKYLRVRYRVDGVILETLKFCDLWGVESSALATALRDAGVPVLRVEREYALSGEGQLRIYALSFLDALPIWATSSSAL